MVQSVSKTYQAHTSTNGSFIITSNIQRYKYTVKTKTSLSPSRKISESSRASHKNFHFNFFHVFTEFNIVSYNNRFNNVNCNRVFPFVALLKTPL